MLTEMSKPLVSIVIPAWNAQNTIGETLASVAAQTYSNLEIVIIDDGSTDSTAAVASAFCKYEPRARLYRKSNGGVASARNLGIEMSRGEWIAPVDADDLWHPTKIEKQVEAALGAATVPGLVYCWFHYIDEEGNVICSGSRFQYDGPALQRMAYLKPVQNGSSILISRAAAKDAGGYDESLRNAGNEGCEDVMIELQVARRYDVACVPEHLVGYRLRPDSMSADSARMRRSWDMVHQGLFQQGVVEGQVFRWNESVSSMELAEKGFFAKEYGAASRMLGRSFAQDPVRSVLFLMYRALRLAVRLLRGRQADAPRIPFSAAGTLDYIHWDPDELFFLKRLLMDKLEAYRLDRLAARERRVRETASGEASPGAEKPSSKVVDPPVSRREPGQCELI